MAVGGRVSNANAPTNLSRSLDRIFEDAQLTSELKLCGRKLKEFPKGAFKYNLYDTVIADLSKNRFSDLPTDVCSYVALEQLRLHHNVLKSLPDQLCSLQALSHLILSRNQLSVLPSCVCQLTNLQVLDVSGNRLVSLPEELGLLTKLTELDASYNQLQVLPPSIGDLDDLRRLRLRRNHLQNVPTELCFLRLTYLDLSYNRIASLPTELRFMTSLLNLLLEANPLSHPPSNICMRGRVHIFKWLDQSAAKEDKKRGVLSEVEFRKTRKYSRSAATVADFRLVNGFLDGRHKRSTVDSGYSTSENGESRWSHGSQELCDPLRPNDLGNKDYRSRNLCNGIGGSHSSSVVNNGYNHHLNTNGKTNGIVRSTSETMSSSSEQTISGHSTPSTLSPGESFNLEDEFYKAMKLRQEMGGSIPMETNGDEFSPHGRMGPDGATSPFKKKPPPSMVAPTHNPDPGGGGGNTPVPTYREYLEAKRQQRASEANNIYKRQGGDGISPTSELAGQMNRPLNDVIHGPYADDNHAVPPSSMTRPNPTGASIPSRIPTNGNNSALHPRPTDLRDDKDFTRSHVKTLQKEAVLSYVKSRVSPCKGSPSPTSPNTSFDSSDGLSFSTSHRGPATAYSSSPISGYSSNQSLSSPAGYPSNHPNYHPSQSINGSGYTTSTPYSTGNGISSNGRLPVPSSTSPIAWNLAHKNRPTPPTSMSMGVLKSRKKSGGGQPFDPDSTPSRLNFTYRRELEKQQHEKQLIDNLRSIIESRLKVSLPSELSSALMDGVVLCHLVNHVRPRAVSSIHVPSPAVPKLTIAKCRLNVENFLDACRRIGVEEEYVCSACDILEEGGTVRVAITVERLLQFYQGRNTPSSGPRNHTPV